MRTWGSPTGDLFATHLNAKLPLYCSLIPDPQALFEDAFRHPWNDLDTYSFPPFHLVESLGSGQRDPKSLSDLWPEKAWFAPPPPTDPTTTGPPTVEPAAAATTLQPVPRRRPRPEPSRVATLKRLLRKSGFSRGAALEMSSCVRESTTRLYQSQWLSFCGWCRGRGVSPVDATISLIVDFLIHLRRDKSYRAAINSVLPLKGLDFANLRELSMLFRSFWKACSPTDLRPPAWDVALVLQSLTGAPYEPLRDAEERFLTHKTLFLVALASAKRVGELHALSYRVSHSVGWKEVSFSFVPGFCGQNPGPVLPRPAL